MTDIAAGVPLKRLFRSIDGGSWGCEPEDGEVTARCIRGTDFDYDHLSTNMERAPVRGFARRDIALRAAWRGDLIIEKSGGGQNQPVGRAVVHRSDEVVVPSNFAARLRPREDVDPRFACYVLNSLYSRGEVWRVIEQVTGIQNLDLEAYLRTRVVAPSTADQRGLADFLDTETSRIDQLVAKRRRIIELADEANAQLLEQICRRHGYAFPRSLASGGATELPERWRMIRLGMVLNQLTNGYVGPTRDILQENGIRYIQSLHIKGGVIDFSRGAYFVDANWHMQRPRIHLQAGDVLIVQTGDIGQVAVVPPGFGEASCHALLIARAKPDLISGAFLGEYLRSPFGRQWLLSFGSGALHPHLEGSIRDVPVVVPPLGEQEAILAELAVERDRSSRLLGPLGRQIALLGERRQALITAAVTGRIEIPAAA